MILIYPPEVHEKSWGRELWIHNGPDYCGKILQFNKDAKFSLHFHIKKTETWYVASGKFELITIDTNQANIVKAVLAVGSCIHVRPGEPHQLICLEKGDIFECSTEHFEDDSYRIAKGDSQSKP